MTDPKELIAQLQPLAEAATPEMREWFTLDEKGWCFAGEAYDAQAYIAAANPATIIALLDCMEALQAEVADLVKDRAEFQQTINEMCNAIPDYDWSGGACEWIRKGFADRNATIARLDATLAQEALARENVSRMRQQLGADLEAALARLAAMEPFVVNCSGMDGGMVNGNRLSISANKALGFGEVVGKQEAGASPVEPLTNLVRAIHYPGCWDTAAYPTAFDAIWEIVSTAGCAVHPSPTEADYQDACQSVGREDHGAQLMGTCSGHSDGRHREDLDGSCMGKDCNFRFRAQPSQALELSDDEIRRLADLNTPNTETGSLNYRAFARAIIAAINAKGNTQ